MYQLYKYYFFVVGIMFIYAIYYRLKYKKERIIKENFEDPEPENKQTITELQKEKDELLSSVKKDINIMDNNLYVDNVEKSKKMLYEEEQDKIEDYKKAYEKYNEEEKIKATNIDLLDMGNKIESGIMDLTYKIYNLIDKSNAEDAKYSSIANNEDNSILNKPAAIENFTLKTRPDSKTPQYEINKNKNNNKVKNKKYTNYFDYVFSVINDIFLYVVNYSTRITGIELDENNMMPAGLLLILISGSLFFIDISS